MARYVRLYLHFLRFSFSKAMEFRLDFFFRIFMDVLYYAVNIAFFRVVFRHTEVLASWSEPQVMVFVAGFLFLDGLYMTVFSSNLWWLPIFVNKGDLDYHLTRPVSSLFFLSLREFSANSFVNVLLAGGILVWALLKSGISLFAPATALYVALLILGTVLHYMVNLTTTLPVFWTHSARGFQQVFWSLQRFMERPDGIFRGWVRRILVTVLPFAIMTSFPARLLLDGFQPRVLFHILAVTFCYGAFIAWFWKRAIAAYSSASS